MSGVHDSLVEDLQYMRDVFMSDAPFKEIILEGPRGDEEFTMRGDDLGGFCFHFNNLLKHFEVDGAVR